MNRDILAFDPTRRSNGRLMADCDRLGYLVAPVIDITYGKGNFWTEVAAPDLRFDLDDRRDAEHVDLRHLPLDDASVGTVVFDPGYKLNGTSTGRGPSALDDAYGVSGPYRSAAELRQFVHHGIDEAWRALWLGGLLLLKCQAQQSSGKLNDQPGEFTAYSLEHGWKAVDHLHVASGVRSQEHRGPQRTARRNYSTLVVLRRGRRKSTSRR